MVDALYYREKIPERSQTMLPSLRRILRRSSSVSSRWRLRSHYSLCLCAHQNSPLHLHVQILELTELFGPVSEILAYSALLRYRNMCLRSLSSKENAYFQPPFIPLDDFPLHQTYERPAILTPASFNHCAQIWNPSSCARAIERA